MSSNRIRLVLALEVHNGKFPEFQKIVQQLVTVSEREVGTLSYAFFLSNDQKHCRLIETYKDVAAITTHFKGPAVQQLVPQLLTVASVALMEFCGDPGPEVTAMAAQFNPGIFQTWQGFDH